VIPEGQLEASQKWIDELHKIIGEKEADMEFLKKQQETGVL
jgi:hypothetical protein